MTTTQRALESECQRTIVAAACIHGWRVHAERPAQVRAGKHVTPIQGHKGFPDLVLVRGRQLWFVELKRKPNKVEGEQRVWLDALATAGASTHVVWVPEGMQTFIDWLGRPA